MGGEEEKIGTQPGRLCHTSLVFNDCLKKTNSLVIQDLTSMHMCKISHAHVAPIHMLHPYTCGTGALAGEVFKPHSRLRLYALQTADNSPACCQSA